jgi:hypothetical protein
MREPFIGSDAARAGDVTGHQLRTRYRALFPDVYVSDFIDPTLRTRTTGAWLWSDRRAVVAGLAASAWYGASWIDDDIPVELIWRNTHPPDGLIVRNECLQDDEIARVGGVPVTTRVRTAFDIGRRHERDQAVAHLDALMRVQSFSIEEVLLLAKRYRGARGLSALRKALPLVDGGAASPQETRLRLLFNDAGLPRPTTQIPVVEDHGRLVRMLDMGWEDMMVAAEYDGDQHRTSRRQYVKDVRVLPKLERMGWIVIRVLKEDRDADILRRVTRALVVRGWGGSSSRH